MRLGAVLVGTADAVRAALSGNVNWNGFEPRGAALIGAGDVDLPLLARAPAWDALSFGAPALRTMILAAPAPSPAVARAVLARAADARLRSMVIENGAVRTMTLDDLVGQPLGDVDWARIRERIAGKRVLVTGGGGSIGGELARRLSTLAPARLTLLDSSEHNLYRINLELPQAQIALSDIRDARATRRWIQRERPEIVFHAAALKQVPLVERFPSEGVFTNVAGLRHVADAAREVGADLIFVSTDKAVEPLGAMGASKRLGELYCQALDRAGGRRAIPVRLGNVLGSAGSVAPVFAAQFAAGGPLTVTDANVTRYFLSIPQAADVLLQAAALGLSPGSPRGASLVIDMGEALPVVELARDVIRLNGLRPDVDMPITFVGLRPGEKLHERLIASDESAERTGEAVIAAISKARTISDLNADMDRLIALAEQGAETAIVQSLFAAIGMSPPQLAESA